jgi:tRNA 2-thiouridine synthesizing protein A
MNVLDVSGLTCPVPLVKTKKRLNTLQVGDILQVISTDPHSQNDLKKFCQTGKCKVLNISIQENKFIFEIEKT